MATKFVLRSGSLEKWIYQNKAEYTEHFYYGCLQDNFILECKRGMAFCYEYPLNCWTSTHIITFIPYRDTAGIAAATAAFMANQREAEREEEEENAAV